MQHTIILAPEILGNIGPLPVTNTMVVTWITMILLSAVAFLGTRNLQEIPGSLQNVLELIIDGIYGMVEGLAGSESKTKSFFPFVATFFLFIATANWLGLFPGFTTIGINRIEDGQQVLVPIFRSVNSDLNTTLALALVSAFATHFFAVKYLGVGNYIKRWISLNPIFLFVGILEIIGEGTKVLSLSLRLFGNIFAGEVMLSTISNLLAFIAPLPFYFMEILVGVVQAAVFMMLTLVFMVILSERHMEEGH